MKRKEMRFDIVMSQFHGGSVVSRHATEGEALRASKRLNKSGDPFVGQCTCSPSGCSFVLDRENPDRDVEEEADL